MMAKENDPSAYPWEAYQALPSVEQQLREAGCPEIAETFEAAYARLTAAMQAFQRGCVESDPYRASQFGTECARALAETFYQWALARQLANRALELHLSRARVIRIDGID